MYNPVSTYRIQFHKGFTFDDFEPLIPYFEKLGIGAIYASPVFTSVPGSTHGYDGIDPLSINPEIGTLPQLKRICKKLKAKKIGWIQDIVPNHMAYQPDNERLMDLLENGPNSRYKAYFDTGLSGSSLFGSEPLMVPFLGDELDTVLERGELSIEQTGEKYVFNYGGNRWPLRPGSYPDGERLDVINKNIAVLKDITQKQYYRLCNWKETNNRINFRRFFTVNSLICLNMQNDAVFNDFHQLIAQLVKEDVFQGLRIDHVDGLYDPSSYLSRLRNLVGDDIYIIAEKILEPGEQLPQWPIQGSTGYDFLSTVNNLLTNRAAKKQFTDYYEKIAGNKVPVNEQIRQKKACILYQQMAGELDNLVQYFTDEHSISAGTFKRAIAEFLIRCPVYRYYGNRTPFKPDEKKAISSVLNSIAADEPHLKSAASLLKKSWLSGDAKGLQFYQRCMQFTGPLMAKGVEDTLMYTYNRFIAHNEVGDGPASFGIPVDEFHRQMELRQLNWPLAMNGTATHDTKRGEDARARLNVLTDVADLWLKKVNEWRKLNRKLIVNHAPDANDEYFIYQTLIGTYPMPGEPADEYLDRLEQYLEKTIREAKVHSDWTDPNEEYEGAVKQFAGRLLDPKGSFWQSFAPFHEQICKYGIVNSLTQVLLKLTAPGVPDIYQGCERWDLSMVDPDNRRPVDYLLRKKFFQTQGNPDDLWAELFSGSIKQWLVNTLLKERRINSKVFAEGQYIALQTTGAYNNHIIAYARRLENTWYTTIAPLGLAGIDNLESTFNWNDTAVSLPENLVGSYENILTGKKGTLPRNLKVAELFGTLPLALLKIKAPVHQRSAGILMHITSLPSAFGIGDFGPQARFFADKLKDAGQRYWQLLPLTPVSAESHYSPYSGWSAMGGNILLISPEMLIDEGLLTHEDLKPYRQHTADCVNFEIAQKIKTELLMVAYQRFKDNTFAELRYAFDKFCGDEKKWLDDFGMYAAIKGHYANKPWYQWPGKYKFRDKKTLAAFANSYAERIQERKWQQFIFSRQWKQLKTYCNGRNILLFGDLPFYVGYDSVDVWANPDIFSLQKNGDMHYVAGVPPDYFNANGQLWGTPVFRWDKLKAQNYSWWAERMRQNVAMFDLVRLDHFRALSAYWSVPAAEETAINGKWEPGPGVDLFNVLKRELGKLPFVAEDLGDIDDAVYALRDAFGLPGMKVLQFAFGGSMAASPHIPHNYTPNHIVYTGTHDNNTTTGWYQHECDKTARKNIVKYIGGKVNAGGIAKTFIKMALSSVAKVAIIPIQDVYAFGGKARMNTPAIAGGNWQWRLTPAQLQKFPTKQLLKWTRRFNRVI
ncbi:malto-oligosyltrehalose synthase [Mucilaginibacter sp. L3T2-6]|uniref:malto-oligosyltrehalose synthase n=1 Tax=Mucilaginibacter sp. L3T2-6 TaxID=3062491 RepID=UPI002676A44D|nr:malto-oligosyltrehalose synthase [Mucilaginibacter sp. L3T2-6]MDO3643687.1 malto-oligosyltrehalose synthase [Mucilaginibacter sp. L3T2-6]MDV6216065.1 malto-oligosyltrehalose synthase [Mucilaginibacter sp. L3T2-6]